MSRYVTQYRARCKDCADTAAFFTKQNRDDWAYAHPLFDATRGHEVVCAERQLRP